MWGAGLAAHLAHFGLEPCAFAAGVEKVRDCQCRQHRDARSDTQLDGVVAIPGREAEPGIGDRGASQKAQHVADRRQGHSSQAGGPAGFFAGREKMAPEVNQKPREQADGKRVKQRHLVCLVRPEGVVDGCDGQAKGNDLKQMP